MSNVNFNVTIPDCLSAEEILLSAIFCLPETACRHLSCVSTASACCWFTAEAGWAEETMTSRASARLGSRRNPWHLERTGLPRIKDQGK